MINPLSLNSSNANVSNVGLPNNPSARKPVQRKYTVLSEFGKLFKYYISFVFIKFLVANRQPFYLEKLDVSLSTLTDFAENFKFQKLEKHFDKKFPGVLELLETSVGGAFITCRDNHNSPKSNEKNLQSSVDKKSLTFKSQNISTSNFSHSRNTSNSSASLFGTSNATTNSLTNSVICNGHSPSKTTFNGYNKFLTDVCFRNIVCKIIISNIYFVLYLKNKFK